MDFSQVVLIVFAVSSTFVGTAGLSIIANGVAFALGEVQNSELFSAHFLMFIRGNCMLSFF